MLCIILFFFTFFPNTNNNKKTNTLYCTIFYALYLYAAVRNGLRCDLM